MFKLRFPEIDRAVVGQRDMRPKIRIGQRHNLPKVLMGRQQTRIVVLSHLLCAQHDAGIDRAERLRRAYRTYPPGPSRIFKSNVSTRLHALLIRVNMPEAGGPLRKPCSVIMEGIPVRSLGKKHILTPPMQLSQPYAHSFFLIHFRYQQGRFSG